MDNQISDKTKRRAFTCMFFWVKKPRKCWKKWISMHTQVQLSNWQFSALIFSKAWNFILRKNSILRVIFFFFIFSFSGHCVIITYAEGFTPVDYVIVLYLPLFMLGPDAPWHALLRVHVTNFQPGREIAKKRKIWKTFTR